MLDVGEPGDSGSQDMTEKDSDGGIRTVTGCCRLTSCSDSLKVTTEGIKHNDAELWPVACVCRTRLEAQTHMELRAVCSPEAENQRESVSLVFWALL